MELYCKRGGEYFIYNGSDNIGIPLQKAKELGQVILTKSEYNAEFERAKATGRKILSLSVSAENDALLRELAAEKSMTVSRAVEWLVEEHFRG